MVCDAPPAGRGFNWARKSHSYTLRVKLLLDTNILIPLEPTSTDNVEENTAAATRLVQLALGTGTQLYLHPSQQTDFANDTNQERRNLRLLLTGKYLVLERPPPVLARHAEALGTPTPESNDAIDNNMLATVEGHAVDYLVSEDAGVHRKAARLGIPDRVLTLRDAVDLLESLFEVPTAAPPAVRGVAAYELNSNDPIWETFRDDYPGFDEWLAKTKRQHRPSWFIEGEAGYAGVAIIKQDDVAPGLTGKVLKLCSFKIDPSQRGLRFGELLLKPVFGHAFANKYDWIYVTVFEKHADLINLLQEFGFEGSGERTDLGELVLTKPLRPSASGEILRGFAFNKRFGPLAIDRKEPGFVVPIQPQFHEMLFPELEEQMPLVPGQHPFGNAIRKAYLCHSSTKKLQPGALLAFYRSRDLRAVTSLGIVEEVLRTSSPDAAAAVVGNRTVYTFEQIKTMCNQPVLVILFRQVLSFSPPIRLRELTTAGVLAAHPQSIQSLTEEGKQWLLNQAKL